MTNDQFFQILLALLPSVVVFLTALLVGIVVSGAVAAVTFVLVEHPFLLLRDRLLRRL